jgi:ATP-dependent protease ClpP protease subunit
VAEGRVLPELLAYKFGVTLRKAFKGKPTSLELIANSDLIADLMENVPDEAYQEPEPFYHGHLFYHEDVDQESARDLNCLLISAHIALKKGVPIRLVLSSYGGDVHEAMAIVGTIHEIQRAGREVDIHIPGYAMSAGSLILQAGTRRTIEPYGYVMVHNPWWDAGPRTFNEHQDDVEAVDRLRRIVFGLYAQRSNKDLDWWLKFMDRRDRYLSAQEALDLRLVDEVLPNVKYRRFRQTPDEEE